MATIQQTVRDSAQTPLAGVTAVVAPVPSPAFDGAANATVIRPARAVTDEAGLWTMSGLNPGLYSVELFLAQSKLITRFHIQVGSDAEYNVEDIVTDPPAAPESSALVIERAQRVLADDGLSDRIDPLEADLGGPRPPTGGAGGVLDGNYPNPGFAVDMAEQAELDALAALKLDKAANLGDVADAAAVRDNLGLGDAATQDAADLPVSTAQGAALDTKAALVDEITRFPSDMYINVAGPTLVNYGDAVCMNLRQAVNDYVTFRCMIPLHWQTFDVDVYWTLALSVAGSPTLRIDYKGIGVGDATNAVPSVGTNHTSTAAGAPFVLRKSTVLANIVAEPSKALFIRVFRLASGGDGLAANIGVERVTLRRSL